MPENSFGFRAYPHPVDPGLPLREERQLWSAAGVATIRGDEAEITMTKGEITRKALRDLEALLRERGVAVMIWDRHLSDGTVRAVRRRIPRHK